MFTSLPKILVLFALVFAVYSQECPELLIASYDGDFEAAADETTAALETAGWTVNPVAEVYFDIGSFQNGATFEYGAAPPSLLYTIAATDGVRALAIPFDSDPGTNYVYRGVTNTGTGPAARATYDVTFEWTVAYEFFDVVEKNRQFTFNIPQSSVGPIVVFETVDGTPNPGGVQTMSDTFSQTFADLPPQFQVVFSSTIEDSFEGPGVIQVDSLVLGNCVASTVVACVDLDTDTTDDLSFELSGAGGATNAALAAEGWTVTEVSSVFFETGAYPTGDMLAAPTIIHEVFATEGGFALAIPFDSDPGTNSVSRTISHTLGDGSDYIVSFDWTASFEFFGLAAADREFYFEIPESGDGQILLFENSAGALTGSQSGYFSQTFTALPMDFDIVFSTVISDAFEGPGVIQVDNIVFGDCTPPTPSISTTPSLSATPTASLSVGASPSNTKSISTTTSASPSTTPSASASISTTPSASASISVSPSTTPSLSATPTASLSVGASPSNTKSISTTSSASPSTTPSASASISTTPSASVSLSASPSTTPSESASISVSPSTTPSLSATPTASLSVGASPSNTKSISTTSSASPSTTPSASASISTTPSASASISVSPSTTPSLSATPTASLSVGASPSNTKSISTTSSASPSPSVSETNTPTNTPSSSLSVGASPSNTKSISASVTRTFVVQVLAAECPTLPQASFDGDFESGLLPGWIIVDNPTPYFATGIYDVGTDLAAPDVVFTVAPTSGTKAVAMAFDGEVGVSSFERTFTNTAGANINYLLSFDWIVAYRFLADSSERSFTVEIVEAGTGEIVVFSTDASSISADTVSGTFSTFISPASGADVTVIFRTTVSDFFDGPGAVQIDNLIFSCCVEPEPLLINDPVFGPNCVLASATPSVTPSISRSSSATVSDSRSPTSAASQTSLPSGSSFPSPTSVPSQTATASRSSVPSASRSRAVIPTNTATRSPNVVIPTNTATRTPVVAVTSTATRTPVFNDDDDNSTRTSNDDDDDESTRSSNDDDDDESTRSSNDDDDDFSIGSSSSSSASSIVFAFSVLCVFVMALF